MGAMALVYVLLPDLLLIGHAAGTVAESFAQLPRHHRGPAPIRGGVLPVRRHERVFASALKGAGRHAIHPATSLLITPLPLLAAWAGMHYCHGV